MVQSDRRADIRLCVRRSRAGVWGCVTVRGLRDRVTAHGSKACGCHSSLRPVGPCHADVRTRVLLRCMAVTVTLTSYVTVSEVSQS